MEVILQLLLGVALAVLFVLFAAAWEPRRELVIYAVGLIVAALIYVVFAFTGAAAHRTLIEFAGVVIFTLFAAPVSYLPRPPAVPGWYPVACISFDLIVAAALALKLRRGSR